MGALTGKPEEPDTYAMHLPLILAPSAPPATTSYYITGVVNLDGFYDLGCDAGKKSTSGVIILAFGKPAQQGIVFGTLLPKDGTFTSMKEITDASKQFITGYWSCSPRYALMNIAIGTSNCGSGSVGSISLQYTDCVPGGGNVSYEHGKAWAQMINDVDTWTKSPPSYSDKIIIFGATDIEPAWNYASDTRAWVDGYDEINNRPYYNFGSCDGCSYFGSPTGQPGSSENPWILDDIYYVSYKASPALVIPQIYTEDSAQADQWYNLKAYVMSINGKMSIAGSLTQEKACETNGPCSGTNNTAKKGWDQLYRALNSPLFHSNHNHGDLPLYDDRVAQPIVNYSTDISW